MPHNKQSLLRIQTLCHYVYFGWFSFFDRMYELEMYDNRTLEVPYGEHNQIEVVKSWGVMGMFYNLVKPPTGAADYHTLKIVGDVFSNSTCLYYLFARNTIFYSEFHLGESVSWKKRLTYRLLGLLFRNRKFVFMTKRSYHTFAPITNQRLYLPYLYLGNIHHNPTLKSQTLKILFVGKLGDRRKNIKWMLDALLEIKDENIEIGLAGQMNSINTNFPPSREYTDFTQDYEYYKTLFGDKLHYHGFVDHSTIHELYTQYNVFVLPSKFECVGAVMLEAMAHSIPVVISDTVGAGDYVTDGEEGFVYPLDDKQVFLEKMRLLLDDPELRAEMGGRAYETIRTQHWCGNEELMERLGDEFREFVGECS